MLIALYLLKYNVAAVGPRLALSAQVRVSYSPNPNPNPTPTPTPTLSPTPNPTTRRPRPSSTHAAHRASTPPVLTRTSHWGTEPDVPYGTRTTVIGTGSAYQPPSCRTYHAWPTALPKGGAGGTTVLRPTCASVRRAARTVLCTVAPYRRALVGKVAMDQHGAEGYQETTEVRHRGADHSDHSHSLLATHH